MREDPEQPVEDEATSGRLRATATFIGTAAWRGVLFASVGAVWEVVFGGSLYGNGGVSTRAFLAMTFIFGIANALVMAVRAAVKAVDRRFYRPDPEQQIDPETVSRLTR